MDINPVSISNCVCGRTLTPKHCINCGRKDVYACKRMDRLVVVDNTKYIARGFRCRKCGAEFDESSLCDAPRKGLSITAQRVEGQVTQSLTGLPEAERKRKIAELLGFRGKDNKDDKNAPKEQQKQDEQKEGQTNE
jgi:hypothetical protein